MFVASQPLITKPPNRLGNLVIVSKRLFSIPQHLTEQVSVVYWISVYKYAKQKIFFNILEFC